MVKFVSAIQNLPGAFNYLADILKRASPGSLFLFLDNAHIQTKTFIEDLVFPSQDSTEHDEYKENELFRLYTTYAELNSDREEGLKCAAMCEWVSLMSYWLDRHPMLDLRVNVHLAVKKRWAKTLKYGMAEIFLQSTVKCLFLIQFKYC